jgi:hypothetical protein
MNSFANRFSATKAHDEDESKSVSPAMWGSQGGFGNVAPGAPPVFNVPNVQDVRVTTYLMKAIPRGSCQNDDLAMFDSPRHSSACTPMTRQTPIAESRLHTVRLLWHSSFVVVSLWLSIRGLLLEAILVRTRSAETHVPKLTCLQLASGTVKKVIEINKYLLGTMAGGAGANDACVVGVS